MFADNVAVLRYQAVTSVKNALTRILFMWVNYFQIIKIKSWEEFSRCITFSTQTGVIVGFACDEGVRRNQGRVGAKLGPTALRQALANYPLHGQSGLPATENR